MTSLSHQLPDPRQNELLAALSDDDWGRWRPQLERVDLAVGEVLCEAWRVPSHAYFPTTAIVSLIQTTQAGHTIEIAVVGRDGAVGVGLFLGDHVTARATADASAGLAAVQRAGQAYRLSAQAARCEADRRGPVSSIMLRCLQNQMAQAAQTALCNRFHPIERQLCRRLLVSLDSAPGDEFAMTQEGLAGLLGVRREGVTAAALKLQQAGVIRYRRGRIVVLDRTRLEARACECRAVSRRAYDRLLPIGLPLAA